MYGDVLNFLAFKQRKSYQSELLMSDRLMYATSLCRQCKLFLQRIIQKIAFMFLLFKQIKKNSI